MAERRGPGGHRLADWILALEAVFWLAVCGLALRRLRFARIAALAGSPRRKAKTSDAPRLAGRIGWAVDAATRRVPWGALCFQRGLAAQAMLRLRGQDSVLCYGARNDDALGPSAHVWVRLGDHVVVGGEEAGRFAELARFPPLAGGPR
jgi:hypothetical protein